MNKKIFYYCFVILSFNFLMMGVDAYKCTYNFNVSGWFGGTETVEGYFEVDTQNNKIIAEDNFFGDFDLSVLIADPMYDDAYDETKLISNLNGGCPSQIWACKAAQVVFDGSGDNLYTFFT